MSEIVFVRKNFKDNNLVELKCKLLSNRPVVYILFEENRQKTDRKTTLPKAYIGESTQLIRRMRTHKKDPRRKDMDISVFIGHKKFHRSATYNIETKLINYFLAEKTFQIQNKSQTADETVHDYFEKEFFNEKLFPKIWKKLKEEKIVKQDLEKLENSDIFKLSPFTELTYQQIELRDKIFDYCIENIDTSDRKVFIVEGESGTGKSVLLSSLMNKLSRYFTDQSKSLGSMDINLLVNHSEMRKSYMEIARHVEKLKVKQFNQSPTTFINKTSIESKNQNITLIDEGHLLLSKPDAYNNAHFDNQLEEIIKRSNITILIYDAKQFLKLKSYWNKNKLYELIKSNVENYETHKLTEQLRMEADSEVMHWIDSFVSKELRTLPSRKKAFEFEIFDNTNAMYKMIKEKNKKYGLSRLVATFDFEHKKDGGDYRVDKSGINLPWNGTTYKDTWAEENTVDEVGSIYTVQGFDLNYVGVILGPSVQIDEKSDKLIIETKEYKDTGAFQGRQDLNELETEMAKEQIILNSINVLMKRGIKGLYLYAMDRDLQQKLLQLAKER